MALFLAVLTIVVLVVLTVLLTGNNGDGGRKLIEDLSRSVPKTNGIGGDDWLTFAMVVIGAILVALLVVWLVKRNRPTHEAQDPTHKPPLWLPIIVAILLCNVGIASAQSYNVHLTTSRTLQPLMCNQGSTCTLTPDHSGWINATFTNGATISTNDSAYHLTPCGDKVCTSVKVNQGESITIGNIEVVYVNLMTSPMYAWGMQAYFPLIMR